MTNSISRLNIIVILGGIFLLLSIIGAILPPVQSNGQPGLFIAVETEASDTTHNPAVIREEHVRINFAALGSINSETPPLSEARQRILLNLFDDVQLTAILDRIESTRPDSYVWIGHIEGKPYSQVMLLIRGDLLLGKIAMPGSFYQVRYAGNGLHAINQIDQSALPPEEEPDAGFLSTTLTPQTTGQIQPTADDGSVIDILVAYTQAARIGIGGTAAMEMLIDMSVAETNQTFQNSGINPRLNLVHTVEVTYTETGDSFTDLHSFNQPADGYMDDIHALRDTYYADISVLIVETSNVCGRATNIMFPGLPPSFESQAFVLVLRSCAESTYTFGHELGHTMGGRHDWYMDSTNNYPFTYNHGYVNVADEWMTIMAYSTECFDVNGTPCTQLPYWSNPNITYNGDPMGVPEGTFHAADNRKTLNNTALVVSNFRSRPEPITPTLTVSTDAWPNPAQPGAPLTYTIRVTNTGNVTLTTTISDILPNHVTPTGTLVWTPTLTTPGGIWVQPIMVTVEVDYTGPLTNLVQVTTIEGASGTYTQAITSEPQGGAEEQSIYLPIILHH